MVHSCDGLPILFKIASLAPRQTYDCPRAREVILNDVGKIEQDKTTAEHNKAQTVYTMFY